MNVAIGADHAGYDLKETLKQMLEAAGHVLEDMGVDGPDPVDYPDYAAPVALAVAQGRADRGILLCGSGIGMCIVANKVRGVRAALVWDPEIARLSRDHNDTNVLCLPSRFVTPEEAEQLVRIWLATPFSGAPRHERRRDKVTAFEQSQE